MDLATWGDINVILKLGTLQKTYAPLNSNHRHTFVLKSKIGSYYFISFDFGSSNGSMTSVWADVANKDSWSDAMESQFYFEFEILNGKLVNSIIRASGQLRNEAAIVDDIKSCFPDNTSLEVVRFK